MPKAVYRSGCRDKHNCPRRDSNLGPLTLQSDALTQGHCDLTRQLSMECKHARLTAASAHQLPASKKRVNCGFMLSRRQRHIHHHTASVTEEPLRHGAARKQLISNQPAGPTSQCSQGWSRCKTAGLTAAARVQTAIALNDIYTDRHTDWQLLQRSFNQGNGE